MSLPRLSGKKTRRIRKRLWHKQRKRCYWCGKKTILPERLFEQYLPLDDLYEQGLADQIPVLHKQLMEKVPDFRRKWTTMLATLDHLIEHARGGSYDDTNLVVACTPCNEVRGATFAQLLESDDDTWLESPDAASETTVIIPPDSDWPPS